ncbi:hypothetical protein MA16_Dca019167 [Dendrobium catenatum]|uniref:Uncharacterized protein n=1 Tax=Dendrobium catenatum TaxID=906689 RepID=A0A2I0WVH4_9ASPA|nr:hypothetical protein MA16_Dca019167 [Dendrobium catenatum]
MLILKNPNPMSTLPLSFPLIPSTSPTATAKQNSLPSQALVTILPSPPSQSLPLGKDFIPNLNSTSDATSSSDHTDYIVFPFIGLQLLPLSLLISHQQHNPHSLHWIVSPPPTKKGLIQEEPNDDHDPSSFHDPSTT